MKRFQSARIFSKVGNFRENKFQLLLTLQERAEEIMAKKENYLQLKAF